MSPTLLSTKFVYAKGGPMSADLFKSLCAEILQKLDQYEDSQRVDWDAWRNNARAALEAQPEPVTLTRPDCFNFAMDFLGGTEEVEVRNYIERLESAASAAQPEPVAPTDEEIADWHGQCADLSRLREADYYWAFDLRSDEVAGVVRAALARWGRPTPQPVPVSERLPGPEDCDSEGRCWLCGKVEGDWRLIDPANSGVPQLKYCFSHWLPHWALPVPIPANNTREENLND
jgi:hypothetical protein